MAQGRRPGANDRVIIGCVSAGGRARLLMEQLPEAGQLVALADANMPRALEFKKEKNANWDIYGTHWPILDRKDIDAVIIAGAEFQRIYPCIHACEAGKDVYAEKPLTLYIQEGRTLVNFVRKNRTIFQVGTQQRSMEMNRVACEFVRNGGLGKLKYVSAICYPGSGPTNTDVGTDDPPMPPGFNWDLHLNQGAWRNYHPHWINGRNFGGGEMTNWGAHGVDQIQWALGKDDTSPVEFEPVSEGNNGKVTARYADGSEVRFEIEEGGPWGGAIFIGEKGKLEINRNKFMSNPIDIRDELLKKVDEAEEEVKWSDQTALWQAKWHLHNWIDCIKSRELPRSDVENGHRSIAFCHLVNITRWMGRKLKFDPVKERFINDDEANKWNDRERRKGYELPEISAVPPTQRRGRRREG
jgi:predicted dehydrogenase